MARQQKTLDRLAVAVEVLTEGHPMTVRQVFYQLVSRQVVENKRTMYQAVSDLLVEARKDGTVPWEWIVDRLRGPREVAMWDDLADFAATARQAYRRDVWATQPAYFEVWLEKDALSGIFADVLAPYGVTFNVGRGYDGWTSICDAAKRWGDGDGLTVLYFGDFDPSGEDMFRSFRERLEFFGCCPSLIKCALTYDDIYTYDLPPNFTKSTDSRAAAHIAKWGDVSVELDALPATVLRQRLEQEVRAHMDLDALAEVEEKQRADRRRLAALLGDAA